MYNKTVERGSELLVGRPRWEATAISKGLLYSGLLIRRLVQVYDPLETCLYWDIGLSALVPVPAPWLGKECVPFTSTCHSKSEIQVLSNHTMLCAMTPSIPSIYVYASKCTLLPYFPGHIPEEEWLGEDIDLQCVRRAHRATIQKALRLNVEEGVPRNQVEELADPNRLERDDDSPEYEPRFPGKKVPAAWPIQCSTKASISSPWSNMSAIN